MCRPLYRLDVKRYVLMALGRVNKAPVLVSSATLLLVTLLPVLPQIWQLMRGLVSCTVKTLLWKMITVIKVCQKIRRETQK